MRVSSTLNSHRAALRCFHFFTLSERNELQYDRPFATITDHLHSVQNSIFTHITERRKSLYISHRNQQRGNRSGISTTETAIDRQQSP